MAIALAFQLAYLFNPVRTGLIFLNEWTYFLLYIFVMPVWIFILYLLQVTEIPRTKRFRLLFLEYTVAAAIVLILLILYYFIFKSGHPPRRFLIYIVFFSYIFLLLLRILEYKIFMVYRSQGYNFINVVLIADDKSLSFIRSLHNTPVWGYRIAAVFTSSEEIRNEYEDQIVILPEDYMQVLNDLMEVDLIDEVLYVKNKANPAEIRNVIRSCEEMGVIFRLIYNDDRKINLSSAIKTEIAGRKFLTFINIPHNPYALVVKKVIDVFGSMVLILVFSPFMLVSAILIKVTSPGPIIFTQQRVGLRGRVFDIYKFRTMIQDAESLKKNLEFRNEADSPAFKIRNDPRITKIGRFLRSTGLDELPQLFNVLKGEMSLIGPRPPLPEEMRQYKRWQLRRLSVRPGLSCFWQVKPDRNYMRMQKWMELDLAYIDNWSLRLDFIILMKTIRSVFLRSGL
jgi:exopolysaccharide biosynthesis polyprenyl glycosylphosphotransferase